MLGKGEGVGFVRGIEVVFVGGNLVRKMELGRKIFWYMEDFSFDGDGYL